MQTSANHPLDARDREQTCDRETRADYPPDVYHARMSRLQAAADRVRQSQRKGN
jgi:hypothetical protein